MSETTRFVRFLLASGTAAGVNVGVRWLLGHVMVYELAVALAYLVGMLTAFGLGRMFVFDHGGDAVHFQFTRFAMVNAVAFAQVWLVSVGLARVVFPDIGFAWHGDTVAHMIGVASPVATSYILHKRFSFRSSRA